MPMTRYRFRHAVGAFLEVPTEDAAHCLQGRHAPFEVNHGIGVLAVSAFDFLGSDVGAYRELVLSIVTPPHIAGDGWWPRSALFPFMVGTSSAASRHHAIERWRLPHYMHDIEVDFVGGTDAMHVRAHEQGRPIVELEVCAGAWTRTHQLYQMFASADDRVFTADVRMEGLSSEHEEETGRVVFHDHPMCVRLAGADIAARPFRELWQRNGVQSIESLQLLA